MQRYIKRLLRSAVRILMAATVIFGGAAGGASASDAPKQAIPIQIKMKWIGKPCNKQGKIQVTLKNVSSSSINTFIYGPLGMGGMFTARIKIKGNDEVYPTNGHGFAVPHYMSPGVSEKYLVVLKPGNSITYDFTLSYSDTQSDPDFFSQKYDEFARKGGRLGVYYSLRKSAVRSELADNMYFVGEDLYPKIDTNTLVC